MQPANTVSQLQEHVYAHGVRNSVGYDFHPTTGDLWFTDNGRDFLSFDQPPDELNVVGLAFWSSVCCCLLLKAQSHSVIVVVEIASAPILT